jgi:hypothetical protein
MRPSVPTRLALALLFSVTIAGLLWAILRSEPSSGGAAQVAAPRLYDEPFRGAPRPAH